MYWCGLAIYRPIVTLHQAETVCIIDRQSLTSLVASLVGRFHRYLYLNYAQESEHYLSYQVV